MRNSSIALALVVTIGQVAAQQHQYLAKLTAGQGFFAEPKAALKALHVCQPLKGATVTVLEVQKNLEGMVGLDVARVRIMDGECAGQEGWVGASLLASPT